MIRKLQIWKTLFSDKKWIIVEKSTSTLQDLSSFFIRLKQVSTGEGRTTSCENKETPLTNNNNYWRAAKKMWTFQVSKILEQQIQRMQPTSRQ